MFKIEIFGKIKGYAVDYTKSAISILAGIILFAVSAVFQFHSLWQLDLICVGPIWGYNWVATDYITHEVIPRFADGFFKDGPIYQGTVGGAYDFFLGMNFFGWVLALLSVFFVMLGAVIYFRANYLEFKDALNASHNL